MTEPNSWDLGSEGNSFSFDNLADRVEGLVIDLVERQSTDMDTGQPAFWENGDKKMLSVVTLQTELRDPANPADDGKRTVPLSGSKKAESQSRMAAVLGAVRQATGGTQLQFHGWLALQYVGDGVPTRRGFNAPKLYIADYRPPAMDLDKSMPPVAPPVQQQSTPQQADPWAVNQGPGPGWAQQNQQPAPQQQQPAPAAQPAANGSAVTTAQIEGLRALGIDPASVYGADWQQRVVS